jgi:hypothetical protein
MNFWTIKQLQEQLINDLSQCRTNHERIMVKTIGGKEIREHATALAKTRKLTPAEVSIASKYGYKTELCF